MTQLQLQFLFDISAYQEISADSGNYLRLNGVASAEAGQLVQPPGQTDLGAADEEDHVIS